MKILFALLFLHTALWAKPALGVYISDPETRPVKTRLAREVTQAGAEEFYMLCVQKVERMLKELEDRFEIIRLREAGLDLSVHMPQILNAQLARGHESAVVIGSDAPTLPPTFIEQAAQLLETHDAVLGPATDGGFYLLGTRKPLPSLLEVRWSTENTLADVEHILKGWNIAYLPEWYDVDVRDDLALVLQDGEGCEELCAWIRALPEVTIIVPTRNEQAGIEACWHALNSLTPKPQLIFADGGSVDGTAEWLESVSADVVHVHRRNRAAGMNAGVPFAQGRVLLFLHADTTLSQESYIALIEATQNGVESGAFSLRFADRESDFRLRFLEKGVSFRNRVLHWVYGDQALFVLHRHFRPFPEIGLMEDVAWVKEMRAHTKWKVLKEIVVTSPRRLYKVGMARSVFRNTALVTFYKLGASPERLAKVYYGQREVAASGDRCGSGGTCCCNRCGESGEESPTR